MKMVIMMMKLKLKLNKRNILNNKHLKTTQNLNSLNFKTKN